ncbi:hypothetical protein [Halalkalibacter krulwichiae]|uniref:Uncharacterized protein n=1 Tax=Halalkalibacter krulwichiae TaxID=199441 RepID=A0A1X9M9W5_9BACI|nr:hypothetical protein [Halalkalibacter krulwichiae]ARK29454.1 hypothetical protein BkAM31D_06065 [Halalkalibacter krulwichiae]
MKKGAKLLIGLAVILLILGFVIPVTVNPSNDTRIILDHTKEVYSTPACFDQAELTNNLEETTLGFAKEMNYVAESDCTETDLVGEREPFLISIFK